MLEPLCRKCQKHMKHAHLQGCPLASSQPPCTVPRLSATDAGAGDRGLAVVAEPAAAAVAAVAAVAGTAATAAATAAAATAAAAAVGPSSRPFIRRAIASSRRP